MKKILVPIDGSAESKKAAEQAIAFAKIFGSEITFFTVVELKSDVTYANLESAFNAEYYTLIDTMTKVKTERETAMLDALVQELDCAELKTEKKVVVGEAHPQIVELAENGQYDLIVMGHRGLNPFKRLFLGSVAKRVIEDAPCSVLIVK